MSAHPILDGITRIDKGPPVIVPRAESPRLTASPFQIDHRGEYIAEQRRDADVLDAEAGELHRQAAEKIRRALVLREAADHMEANPPDA